MSLSGQARRNVREHLPLEVAAAAMETIEGSIAVNPYRAGKPLDEPFDGFYSARRGTYRIVYRIDEAKHQVEIYSIRQCRVMRRRRSEYYPGAWRIERLVRAHHNGPRRAATSRPDVAVSLSGQARRNVREHPLLRAVAAINNRGVHRCEPLSGRRLDEPFDGFTGQARHSMTAHRIDCAKHQVEIYSIRHRRDAYRT